MMASKILHLDLDAFYPSVEALDEPRLVGEPVIVGGLGKRGVVASASYEARRMGVHSAQPMAVARRLCPDGVYLRPRFDRYRALSREIFAIYRTWTELVEPLSLDEAYLDVSAHAEPGTAIARTIKDQVHSATGLTVSAGVSHNKFLAKLASAMDKPDGLTVIGAADVREVLDLLPVSKLWGVGPATEERLREAGFHRIGQVATADPGTMRALLGKQGPWLVQLARGEDSRSVSPPGRPKTLSCETTFDRDLTSWRQSGPTVRGFAERLATSLEQHDLLARTVVLKVRFPDFHTVTRSRTPARPVREPEQILAVARELARRVPLAGSGGMRLVGLGLQNLVDPGEVAEDGDDEPAAATRGPVQLPLFEASSWSAMEQRVRSVTLEAGPEPQR